MSSTSSKRTRLAPGQRFHRDDRERFALRRLRNALADVIRDPAALSGQRTPEPAYPWHDLTRETPRAALPFEKERAMLHAAIRQGCTTREKIVRYRAAQLLDDFAQFPDEGRALDVLYTNLVTEEAEAIEAQTIAHALPTETNREAAIRESREAIGVMELECKVLELYPLPTHPLPHGAVR